MPNELWNNTTGDFGKFASKIPKQPVWKLGLYLPTADAKQVVKSELNRYADAINPGKVEVFDKPVNRSDYDTDDLRYYMKSPGLYLRNNLNMNLTRLTKPTIPEVRQFIWGLANQHKRPGGTLNKPAWLIAQEKKKDQQDDQQDDQPNNKPSIPSDQPNWMIYAGIGLVAWWILK